MAGNPYKRNFTAPSVYKDLQLNTYIPETTCIIFKNSLMIIFSLCFVFPGSLLVACSHFGAYVCGTDIDYNTIHGIGMFFNGVTIILLRVFHTMQV